MDTLRGLWKAVSARRLGRHATGVAVMLLAASVGGCGTYRICVEPIIVRVDLSVHERGRQTLDSQDPGQPVARPESSPMVRPAAERRHTHD